mmetsp:Transcript_59220/g.133330  ORF Transcript_59220/g.133330 Transcript_59220/m.133330 type:complete len:267 (+) Transcript_59220:1551-2351(+)
MQCQAHLPTGVHVQVAAEDHRGVSLPQQHAGGRELAGARRVGVDEDQEVLHNGAALWWHHRLVRVEGGGQGRRVGEGGTDPRHRHCERVHLRGSAALHVDGVACHAQVHQQLVLVLASGGSLRGSVAPLLELLPGRLQREVRPPRATRRGQQRREHRTAVHDGHRLLLRGLAGEEPVCEAGCRLPRCRDRGQLLAEALPLLRGQGGQLRTHVLAKRPASSWGTCAASRPASPGGGPASPRRRCHPQRARARPRGAAPLRHTCCWRR